MFVTFLIPKVSAAVFICPGEFKKSSREINLKLIHLKFTLFSFRKNIWQNSPCLYLCDQYPRTNTNKSYQEHDLLKIEKLGPTQNIWILERYPARLISTSSSTNVFHMKHNDTVFIEYHISDSNIWISTKCTRKLPGGIFTVALDKSYQ